MFIAKKSAASKAVKLRERRLIDHSTSGGSSDTDENEFAVTPAGSPPLAVVTIVTPVA